jgi:glycine amidinotransferase
MSNTPNYPTVSADNEWSPLRAVILGRAENSCFPSEPNRMIEATMPLEHQHEFKANRGFPEEILKHANQELEHFSSILLEAGVKVYRPTSIDWFKTGGYTSAMPRDGLLTVGNHIIEACFAWACRRSEISLSYEGILSELAKDPSVKVIRAPQPPTPDTLYDGITTADKWAINNTRPAFDAADFMRFGNTLIGQLSNVTNMKGVEHLRASVPAGYSVEILNVDDPHAMHIDATLLPLRPGLLVYNPERVSEEALRQHAVLRDWNLQAYPYAPSPRAYPPRYMCSGWLLMNVLSLDEKTVVVEEGDRQFAEFVRGFGITVIMCPFKNVNSIGGSFHCATVDLVRDG